MAAAAALVYAAISVTLLVLVGSELDRDAVFPFAGNPGGETTFSSGPTPANPPDSVRYAIAAIGGVVAVPIVFRRRLFLLALSASTLVITIALVITILRLGLLLTPVLTFQVLALRRILDGAKFDNSHDDPAE